MKINWQSVATPTAEAIPELRSCRNCGHRVGLGSPIMWECDRTAGAAYAALMYECLNLKLWVPRRRWWQRFWS